MARYIATMQGSRGSASRLGTPQSGIHSHTRGWNLGGEVQMGACGDEDTAVLTLTGGSNGRSNLGVEIAAFEEERVQGEPRPAVRYVVRLPNGDAVHGYVGEDTYVIVKRSER